MIRTVQMWGVLLVPKDYTWDIVEQFHWSYLEVNIGILCASVPALQPFVKQYLGSVFGSQPRSSRGLSDQQPQPYSTAIGRNAERREAKLQGYELDSRDDRSEDDPFKPGAAIKVEELRQTWRRDGAQHATAITSERHGSDHLESQSEASFGMRFREASPQGIAVRTERSVKYSS
ncbi:hypothetical protein SLS62_007330 [Diatrype stigma]|uniref:Rhodopsin domain-containing protein n=1 Tax=Diatrype stigma TaxID=117547 RepID=A0AAN9UNF8_9PEZI